MTKIVQGGEDPAVTAARKAAWQARPPELPENTPLTMEDIERHLLATGVDVTALKRGRP